MADEKRGGRRIPKEPATYSGVGSRSRRTDGGPIKGVPSIQESTDLNVGDRAKLEQGQKTVPLRRASSPSVSPSGPSPSPSGGVGGSGGSLPENLFSMPTNRPGEPQTEGLPFGPGGGPEVLQSNQITDDKQLLIDFLARGGNEDAVRIRSGMAAAQREPEAPVMAPAPPIEEEEVPAEEEFIEFDEEEPTAEEEVAPEEVLA